MRRVIPQRSVTNGLGAGSAPACRLPLPNPAPHTPGSPHGHNFPTGTTPTAETVLATSGLVGSHPDPSKILCLCQLPLCLASKPTWRSKKETVRHILAWKALNPSQKAAPGGGDQSQHSTGVPQYAQGTRNIKPSTSLPAQAPFLQRHHSCLAPALPPTTPSLPEPLN